MFWETTQLATHLSNPSIPYLKQFIYWAKWDNSPPCLVKLESLRDHRLQAQRSRYGCFLHWHWDLSRYRHHREGNSPLLCDRHPQVCSAEDMCCSGLRGRVRTTGRFAGKIGSCKTQVGCDPPSVVASPLWNHSRDIQLAHVDGQKIEDYAACV